MNLKLLSKLLRFKYRLTPSYKFKNALWRDLSKEWDRQNKPNYYWYEFRGYKLAGAVAIIVIVFGGALSSAYAYTSPAVTIGSTLFPLKRALEVIEEKFNTNPNARAEFYLKQISRREAEKIVLEKKLDKIKKDNNKDRVEPKPNNDIGQVKQLRQAKQMQIELAKIKNRIDLVSQKLQEVKQKLKPINLLVPRDDSQATAEQKGLKRGK